MKWTCDDVTRQLEPYVDGELAPAAREHVQAHLGGCERCRGAATALREFGVAVRAAEAYATLTPEEAAAFWPAVRGRIREVEALGERHSLAGIARAIAARLLRAPVLVPALAAFLGLILGVGLLRTEYLVDEVEAAEVESLEGGPASTVMLIQEGRGKPPVIWIFEDGAGAN